MPLFHDLTDYVEIPDRDKIVPREKTVVFVPHVNVEHVCIFCGALRPVFTGKRASKKNPIPTSTCQKCGHAGAFSSLPACVEIPEPLGHKYAAPSPSFAEPQGKPFRGGRAKTKEAIARRNKKKAKNRQHRDITAKYSDITF